VNVIVCDDESDIRMLYRTAFEATGSSVVVARDGVECLTLLDDFVPELVVLDLMMPQLDGFATLEEMRRRAPEIHVVVVSAYASPENKARAATLGAERCFSKLEFLGAIPRLVSSYAASEN
jgi:two-component system OmpR family response regulator